MNLRASWKSNEVLYTATLGLLVPALLVHFYHGPALGFFFVFFCFAIGFPLTLSRNGKLTFIPAWFTLLGMVVVHRLASVTDVELRPWSSWVLAWFGVRGLWAVYEFFIPIAATFLGCVAAHSTWYLIERLRKPNSNQHPAVSDWWLSFGIAALFLMVNLALVHGAVAASLWLKEHKIFPFQDGLWNVMVNFIPAPPWIHEMLATRVGAFAFIASPVAFSAFGIWCAKRVSEPRIVSSIGLLSFVAVGFPSLWAIGDMLINYYINHVAFGMWPASR